MVNWDIWNYYLFTNSSFHNTNYRLSHPNYCQVSNQKYIMSFNIYTAFPRGYCAWVHRAVGMLMEIVASYPPPIYVNHEIIHNQFVVKMFERKWVIFESDLEKIPPWSLVVVSAHWTGPSYFEKLRARWMQWIDATCPLVEKVHREAREFIAKGCHILYIGKKWHQEALGVIDEGEKHFTLIENEEDITSLTQHPLINGEVRQYAILTQTTLSVDDTEKLIHSIQSAFPDVMLPKTGDICYATTNRQRAVKVLAERVDVVIVVGSKNSSNSSKLRSVAESMWKKAYLIDSADEIEHLWFNNCTSVGVTAGASWPEELVEWVVERLSVLGGVFSEELRVVEEKVEFPYTLKIQS